MAAALCLGFWNLWWDFRSGSSAHAAMESLSRQMPAAPSTAKAASPAEEDPPTAQLPEGAMPVVEIEGVGFVGMLEIPVLNLSLPIISQWDDTLSQTAPCRYLGSVYQNDLIIAGHNYSGHFGSLYTLEAGDQVLVADMVGNRFSYTVTGLEQLPGTAVEEMAAGQWDLTLFTCTPDGAGRVTVRCRLAAHGEDS